MNLKIKHNKTTNDILEGNKANMKVRKEEDGEYINQVQGSTLTRRVTTYWSLKENH